MKTFGLIGFPLGHSFSRRFFEEKFSVEKLSDYEYVNFELKDISEFPSIFKHKDNICGLNCTIPYKQQIIPFLDEMDDVATKIGAVNTIKINRNGGQVKLKGFNTDVIGFEQSLSLMLGTVRPRAMVLGTGGASKAVIYVLAKMGIDYVQVSRTASPTKGYITYSDIEESLMDDCKLIINTTPLGTFPKVDGAPDIPYQYLTSKHFLFDLVYNPEVTTFLKKGLEHGASIKNGSEMLKGQAIAAWNIWNS